MGAAPARTTRETGHLHVAVIGGGVAGISAARRLRHSGLDVTVLEAGQRLGGCVRTVSFAGSRVDVGAEAIHTAAPGPLKLAADLGLTPDLVTAADGPTWIEVDGDLRPLPDGVGPGGPTRLAPLLTSRLLTPRGLLRAAMEPALPPSDTRDATVGAVLADRFGRQVVERIVDPLLGGLHAGDVDRLALDAAAPQLAALLDANRSVVLAARRRRRRSTSTHGFVTVRGGLGRLVDAAADDLSGAVRTGVAVRAVVDTGSRTGRYRIETDTGVLRADAVVVATPAHAAGQLLAPLGDDVRGLLDGIPFASAAVALLAYPAEVADRSALTGTGVLLPSRSGRLLKAATFLSTKWPHLDTGHVLVRASAGRARQRRVHDLDDDELAGRLARDLDDVAGLDAEPVERRVERWPASMPQLEVGHRRRIATARAHLAVHPGVALAGASYDGVGLASAMRSGTTAAEHVLQQLRDQTRGPR